MALAKLARSLQLCALAGVEEVRLVDGHFVVGRWKNTLARVYGDKAHRLVPNFLNWPNDPKSILTFTNRYGPLDGRPKPLRGFRFSLEHWIARQRDFRQFWNVVSHLGTGEKWATDQDAVALEWENGQLTYIAASLRSFLELELITCSPDRLRTCANPECPSPLFVASHLKQRYCSEKCSGWGQRQAKKQWWAEHGTRWRKSRR